MEKRVRQFIRETDLIKKGDKILAAVSGGADSICLLLVLDKLKKELGIYLEAVTVNHGIRGEAAEEDVLYVKKICNSLGMPLHICRINVPKIRSERQLSEEEAARIGRYRCFLDVKSEIDATAVAVAHHKEDNCETILHNLFRGSGLLGISGLKAERVVYDGDESMKIIRPMLSCSRKDIEQWLTNNNVSWQTDETNNEECYTRNRLRNTIIPLIEESVNKQAVTHVVQASRTISEAFLLIEDMAKSWIDRYSVIKSNDSTYNLERKVYRIPVKELSKERTIIRREIYMQICRSIVSAKKFKDMRSIHMEMIDSLIEKETSKTLELPCGIRVTKEYKYMLFTNAEYKHKTDKKEKFSCDIILPDGNIIKNICVLGQKNISFDIFQYNGEKIPQNNYTKWFDYDKIKIGLCMRTRKTGDYFILDNGGKKSLKSFFIDQKIKASDRDDIIILADGSHVLWVETGRISAAYKVTCDTKNILELHIKEEILS